MYNGKQTNANATTNVMYGQQKIYNTKV